MKKVWAALFASVVLIAALTPVKAEEQMPNPTFISGAVFTEEGMADALTFTFGANAPLEIQSNMPLLMVNGSFVPVKTMLVEGRTLVPLEKVVLLLKGQVMVDGATNTIVIKTGKDNIAMHVNETTAKINDKAITMDIAPAVYDGTTYIPMRFLADYMNCDIGYVPGEMISMSFHNSIVWIEQKNLAESVKISRDKALIEVKTTLKNLAELGLKEKGGLTDTDHADSIEYFLSIIPTIKQDIEKQEFVCSLGRYYVFKSNTTNTVITLYDSSNGRLYNINFSYPAYSVQKLAVSDPGFFLPYYVFG